MATATTFAGALEADLTTAADVDVYRYTADSSDGRWFRIKAAGLSLVAAKLEVIDGMGQVVGSAQAVSPLQNDVTVYVPELVPGATYYLRVSSASTDVFGVGAYRVAADTTADGQDEPDPYALADNEVDGNNTIAAATVVSTSAGPYGYSFRSSVTASTDVDYFRVHSPSSSTGTTKLMVNVSAVGDIVQTQRGNLHRGRGQVSCADGDGNGFVDGAVARGGHGWRRLHRPNREFGRQFGKLRYGSQLPVFRDAGDDGLDRDARRNSSIHVRHADHLPESDDPDQSGRHRAKHAPARSAWFAYTTRWTGSCLSCTA